MLQQNLEWLVRVSLAKKKLGRVSQAEGTAREKHRGTLQQIQAGTYGSSGSQEGSRKVGRRQEGTGP